MLRKLVSGLALAAVLPFSLGLTSPLAPLTGPRQFNLTVTWEKHSPDGVSRDMILINGQFPGPVMEINEGEEVWVTVQNLLPYHTTMHYHGM
jgi:FtsP/CotA-like multicopper oxidase with cupredoxin domain